MKAQTYLKTNTESEAAIQQVPYIKYPIQFSQELVQFLIDSGSKADAMQSSFAK